MKLIRKADFDQYLHDAYSNLKPYVRDVDLSAVCASVYKQGMVICERGFTDASSRIGGMATTHRYMILSNHMADLSMFEQGTDWGLCVARCGSLSRFSAFLKKKERPRSFFSICLTTGAGKCTRISRATRKAR